MSDSEVPECQKLLLLDLVESYFIELKKKGKPWGDHLITNDAWIKIAIVVNETGPHYKVADEWKVFFKKMKSDAKVKVGAQRRYINKTGSGLPSVQLSELDFKITSLYGKNHFDGLQGVAECGFPGRKFTANEILNAVPDKPLQKSISGTLLGDTIFETPIRCASPKLSSQNRGQKRTFDSRNIAAKKCDLCGGPGRSIECRYCNKILCVSCDEMYHRHPLRQTHKREKVVNA